MKAAIQRFTQNLAALRDFVDLVGPVLLSHEREQLKSDAKSLEPLVLALNALDSDRFDFDKETLARIQADQGKDFDFDVSEAGEQDRSISIRFHGGSRYGRDFALAFQRLSGLRYQSDLLYGSSLISLVSSKEFFSLLNDALEAKKISRADVASWPLFRRMRESDLYATYLTSGADSDGESDSL